MDINYAAVAEYCKEHYKDTSQHVMRVADEVCNNTFLFDMPWDMERTIVPAVFAGKIDWNYLPSDDTEFLWQFNRHRFFLILAQAYRLSGDDKYAVHFARLINDWIDNAPHSSDSKNRLTWRPLECGLRCEYWTKALRIFGDNAAISDKLHGKIIDCLIEHAKLLYSIDDGFRKNSNWGVIQDHGLYAVSLYLQDKLPDTYLPDAVRKLLSQSHNQIFDDGVHWEQSCMYHSEVLFCLMDAIGNAKLYNQTLPQAMIDNVRKMLHAALQWKKPDNRHPMMGDSDHTDIRDMLTQGAYLLQDGVLKFGGFDTLDYESAWIFGMDAVAEYKAIPTITAALPDDSFKDSGNYYMRTDYSQSANYLHFYNGYSGGGHGHVDRLHFDLCINGDDVLIDSGRYTYVGNRERKRLKSPMAHNTVTINNKTYMPCILNGWEYLKVARVTSHGKVASDKYELVYGGHLGYMAIFGASHINRRILWIKPNIYVIIDDIDSRITPTAQQHFIFAPDGKLTLNHNNTATFITDNSRCEFAFISSNMSVKQKDFAYSPYYNTLQNTTKITTNYKSKHAVTVICGFDKESTDTMLVKSVPLKMANGHNMTRENGEGIVITVGNKCYTIGIAHKELCMWKTLPSGQGFRHHLVLFEDDQILPTIIRH